MTRPGPEDVGATGRPVPVGRGASALLGLALLGLYTANGRAIGAGDVVPATLQAVALCRGDGPVLDRFESVLRTADGRLPGYVTESRGHVVSRYPLGPALVAAPLVGPQVLALDRLRPGWDRDGGARAIRRRCERLGKNAAAAIAATAAVALWHLLAGLGLGRAALPTTLVAALGSGYWSVAGQALWQHGPAALCLTVAMLLLGDGPASRARLAGAGVATALMVACRPIDLVFAVVVAAWVAARHRRPERLAFFAPAALGAALLAGYNVWFFDTLTGGYAAIERMHPKAHGTRGTFTGSLLEGGSGTLFSPSHGLFVYCPWVALGLATLAVPEVAGRLRRWSLGAWLAVGLVPYFVLLATYSCWWGGHCFGPRFWIDAVPILAPILGLGLDWGRRRRAWLAALLACAVVSVAAHAVGFLCYPSSWHGSPTNADRDHVRLWDWSDNELTRGLAEGVRPRSW